MASDGKSGGAPEQDRVLACQPGWKLVVAMARNGVIGLDGDLPWRLSSDLKRFKKLTMGNCLLMGRKTYESIGRPLPGRQTIVLSRTTNSDEAYPEVSFVSDLGEVNNVAFPDRQIMVVGGAELYRLALPFCDELWVTRVQEDIVGDTCFPDLDWSGWNLVSEESFPAGAKDQYPTKFEVWKRIA